MPTATTTTNTTQDVTDGPLSSIPLKGTPNGTATTSATAATLRSLYPRAATAFLHRNVALTQSLLSSASSILHPPSSLADDGLTSHRKKWDILQITFETTVYASPPETEDPEAFPTSLRANQMLSPQSLVTNLHSRSLHLFTPTSQKANAAFLPSQILITLVLASLKLGCPEVGRGIIEDWLARRSLSNSAEDLEGYAKVLELYCLQILPRLEEWDYASDFLQYERELPQDTRDRVLSSLQSLHEQAISQQRPISPVSSPVIAPPSATSSRSVSPSPSLSASSESSNSTHTATPRSPRLNSARPSGKGKTRLHSMTRLTPSSSASASSQSVSSVATAKTVTPASLRRVGRRNDSRGRKTVHQNSPDDSQTSATPVPRAPRSRSLQPTDSITARPPSTLAIIRSYLNLSSIQTSKSKLITLFLLFVVFPVLSFLFRLRRRRVTSVNAGTAEQVRRRLRAAEGKSTLVTIWEEVVRAVMDTVRMGGRGLV